MEPLNPRLLCVLSDQYFLPGLLHNMRYGETLRKWFGADLFGTLARHLLRPKAWIVEQAVQFYETRLDGLPSVGIQLRTATMKGQTQCIRSSNTYPSMPSAKLRHLP